MAIEHWIDKVCKLWEIDDGSGGKLRSYRVYERAEFPQSITPPCVLTYALGVQCEYSLEGIDYNHWHGISEFHLTPDLDKSKLPNLLLFFARIRAAAAGNMTLDHRVEYFRLKTDGASIEGPLELLYGNEAPHWGLRVHWEALETLRSKLRLNLLFQNLTNYQLILDKFNEIATADDATSVRGAGMSGNWYELIDPPVGLEFYHLTSWKTARDTLSQWRPYVDGFAYGLTIGDSPPDEIADVVASSKNAKEFCAQNGLIYMLVPSYALTSGEYCEGIAQYADYYGTIGLGLMRNNPDGWVDYVKNTNNRIRSVNTDIVHFATISTETSQDDPDARYQLCKRVEGAVDGITIQSGDTMEGITKMHQIVDLLRRDA